MIVLNNKYVLHIPLSKFINAKLEPIDIDDALDELFTKLESEGFENFYITKVEGHYRSRSFDELLVTVYCNEKGIVDEIFKEWFMDNNDLMAQEAFSYELNDKLYIENL